MKAHSFVKVSAGAITVGGLLAIVLSTSSPRVQAHEFPENGSDESLVHLGYEIAPVPLNLTGKDRSLVGLGSYLVNAVGDCNGCHNGGPPPNFNYAAGGNPYFGQKTVVDPTTYLAGGADFGKALPPGFYDPGYGSYLGPDIITRNLTPDRTGRAEGGHTLAEFKQIMRTGIDLDHVHPPCTTVSPHPSPANCIPAPVDGNLLQIMPWPVFHNMSDRHLEAIYEYLSAIPCIDGSPDPKNLLHNDCGTPAKRPHDKD